MSIIVVTPATTANIGPGFDCIGAALSMYNQFRFSVVESLEEVRIMVVGKEAKLVSTDKSNLLHQCFEKFYEYIGETPPLVEIEITLGVPLARGLGSSATAIVGGLVAANELAGKPLELSEVMKLAIAIEGHPDNVVPALLGNCQLSVSGGDDWLVCEIPWHREVVPVVAIPNFELSTEEARKVLPLEVNRSEAIFNISHMGLLVRGLESNRGDWLAVAMEDRLHQPYRQSLITGYEVVKEAAMAAGAYNMVISGAGPTLLALTNREKSSGVVVAMREAWERLGIGVEVSALSIDTEGTRVLEGD